MTLIEATETELSKATNALEAAERRLQKAREVHAAAVARVDKVREAEEAMNATSTQDAIRLWLASEAAKREARAASPQPFLGSRLDASMRARRPNWPLARRAG